MARTYVSVTVDVAWTTPRAVCLYVVGAPRKLGGGAWVPRSQIEDGDDIEVGNGQDLSIAEWIADKEGLL